MPKPHKPNFLFFISPDSGILNIRLAKTIKQFQLEHWEKKVFWADEPLESEFWNSISTANLFGPGKVVVVRLANKLNKGFWDQVKPYLTTTNKSSLSIFFFEQEWSTKEPPWPAWFKKHALYQLAQKNKWIFSSKGLNRKNIAKFIQDYLAEKKITIPPILLNKLSQLLPLDSTYCLHELEKLEILASADREVKKEHLQILNLEIDENIFDFINLLLTSPHSLKTWLHKNNYLGQEKDIIFRLLSLLEREAKILWMLYFGEKVYLPNFVQQRKKNLALKLGPSKIGFLFDLCLDLELKIKTGQITPSEALDYLIFKISNLKKGELHD